MKLVHKIQGLDFGFGAKATCLISATLNLQLQEIKKWTQLLFLHFYHCRFPCRRKV